MIRDEKELGTLGAAANCVKELRREKEYYLVINGDTLFEADLKRAYNIFLEEPDIPLVIIKESKTNDRYGGYDFKNGLLAIDNQSGKYISMGAVYAKGYDFVKYDERAEKEKKIRMMDEDFLRKTKCRGFILKESTKFIDIGIPESYNEAQSYVSKSFQKIAILGSED